MFATSVASLAGCCPPLHQRRGVEPRGVERLQDVVAGGGQEARLAEIGLVRRALARCELLVEPRQFLGALADALLQRFVGLAPAPPRRRPRR